MEDYSLSVIHMIRDLSNDSIRRLKYLLAGNQKFFVNPDVNASAAGLLRVVCYPTVMESLSRSMCAETLKSLFPPDVLMFSRLEKYMNALLSVNEIDEQKLKDRIACRYYENLMHEKIPLLEKYITQGERQLEVFCQLADVYKTIACFESYQKKQKAFVFQADVDSLGEIDNRIFDYIKERLNAGYSIAELHYFALLSRILREMICDQDGVDRGE